MARLKQLTIGRTLAPECEVRHNPIYMHIKELIYSGDISASLCPLLNNLRKNILLRFMSRKANNASRSNPYNENTPG